jgi:hypothetical protein
MLYAQFAHTTVLGLPHTRRMGIWKVRTHLFEQLDAGRHGLLFIGRQSKPPRLEFVGVLDVPCHRQNNAVERIGQTRRHSLRLAEQRRGTLRQAT